MRVDGDRLVELGQRQLGLSGPRQRLAARRIGLRIIGARRGWSRLWRCFLVGL